MSDDSEKNSSWSPWDWAEIKKIVQAGQHPTRRALAAALRGSQEVPDIVREYIADRMEKGWPGGAPKKRRWEKVQDRWDADDWGWPEANLEFVELWTVRQFEAILKSVSDVETALRDTERWSQAQVDKWRHMNAAEITEASSRLARLYDLTDLPSKSYDDVIDLVAQRRRIDPEKLKNFDKVESRRKS